ncbi:MAG TPA: peptidoglycan-binding domain-containing protein, partial [Candidatus Paceibacterota bacterium]|nr:peptidoglycan-binding domain-containing protein [Candidatus Paceibacterota bacterium]
DLQVGSVGEDVLALQQILNSDPQTALSGSGVGSSGQESTYFGELTRDAVVRYQEKYRDEILTPLGLSAGTGIVGARTREKLNTGSVSSGGSSAVSTPGFNFTETVLSKLPEITGISQIDVSDPLYTPVIIGGVNFTAQNEVFLVTEGIEIFNASVNPDGTLSVLLDTSLAKNLIGVINSLPENGEENTRQKARESLKAQFNSVGLNGVYVPAVLFVKNEYGESNKVNVRINILKDEQ